MPPIVITHCPGAGGHPWARVNPRWTHERATAWPRAEMWCPDHEQEKRDHVSAALSKATHERYITYGQMPLPSTRMCCNPDPDPAHHQPGAVLPSGKFYHRKDKVKIDGTRSELLDSRCKDCRRAEAQARRDGMTEEQRRAKARNASRNLRERRRRGREEHAAEKIPMVDAAPFRQWLLDHTANGNIDDIRPSVHEMSKLAKVSPHLITDIKRGDRKTLHLDVVDKVLTAYQHQHLLGVWYPPKAS